MSGFFFASLAALLLVASIYSPSLLSEWNEASFHLVYLVAWLCIAGLAIPISSVKTGWRLFPAVFWPSHPGVEPTREKLQHWARLVRMKGHLALDQDASTEEDPFLRVSLQLLVDAVPRTELSRALRSMMEARSFLWTQHQNLWSRLGWSAIAVGVWLALISSLANTNSSSIGSQLFSSGLTSVDWLPAAMGLAIASLICFPLAWRVSFMNRERTHFEKMIKDAMLSIQSAENVKLLARRLQYYYPDDDFS